MKFLLIINNDIDGVGQPAINLCSNLKKKGHESKIIALHKFTKNKNAVVRYNKKDLMNMEMEFLHEGYPKLNLETKKRKSTELEKKISEYKVIER